MKLIRESHKGELETDKLRGKTTWEYQSGVANSSLTWHVIFHISFYTLLLSIISFLPLILFTPLYSPFLFTNSCQFEFHFIIYMPLTLYMDLPTFLKIIPRFTLFKFLMNEPYMWTTHAYINPFYLLKFLIFSQTMFYLINC